MIHALSIIHFDNKEYMNVYSYFMYVIQVEDIVRVAFFFKKKDIVRVYSHFYNFFLNT